MDIDLEIFLRLAAIVVLIGLAAFFAGSEAAFFSLSQYPMKKPGDKKSRIGDAVNSLMEYPRKLIITILIGNESVNILISIMIASVYALIFLDKDKFRHILPAGNTETWVGIISIVTSSLLLFIFGEILPKTAGVKFSRPFASLAAMPLYFFFKIFYPIRYLFRILTDKILGIFGVNPDEDMAGITDEDMLKLLEIGKEEGVLEPVEKALINNIFDFSDIHVRDVMTLPEDIFRLPLDMPLEKVILEIKERGYSRIPVFRDDPDNIVGILSAKDLLKIENRPDRNIEPFLHKPYFIPRQKPIRELLREFQNRRTHLAIVVDEFGKIAGLVTMEDILEEIFGESETENGRHENLRELGENKWEAPGRIDLNRLREKFDIKLEAPDVRTLAGYLLFHFGRMPSKGESISREGFTFTIEEIRGIRIYKVLMEKEPVAQ